MKKKGVGVRSQLVTLNNQTIHKYCKHGSWIVLFQRHPGMRNGECPSKKCGVAKIMRTTGS